MHTYNQDLVSAIVARCISYAPRDCSLCSRCCCCLLLYDRQRIGISLNSAGDPDITIVFAAFTLYPFFSMASFHIRGLFTHSSSKSAMIICIGRLRELQKLILKKLADNKRHANFSRYRVKTSNLCLNLILKLT